MSSFIFNNIIKTHTTEMPEPTCGSFWQSPLWVDILTKTNQAEVIIASDNTVQIIIERRKIWRKYTGLYILGVNGEIITKDFLQSLQEEIVTPYDLFLQLEPLREMKNEE